MNLCNKLLHSRVIPLFACLALASCSTPHNVQVELPESRPEVKLTSYTDALSDLGLMTTIFDTGNLKIQSQDITDKTGASKTTGSEIQKNITEIMKSTLNSIGGQVTFIEYDPNYIQNQMVTGYGSFEHKIIPDVVVTGGITEFDRGLETRGEGTDMDAEAPVSGLPSWVPNDTVGVAYGDSSKSGKARITLDFNLKSFQSLAGISKMTTTNSMEVYKGLHEQEVGITLFGPTFGMKGSTKKVQGRHEAIRLLVQVSMIQMVGKYLVLPYWKLLGDDVNPDPVVLNTIRRNYYNMSPGQRISAVQQWLFLHGYSLRLTGTLDTATRAALNQYDSSYSPSSSVISEKLFSNIYLDIPVEYATVARRKLLNKMLASNYRKPVPQAKRKQTPKKKQATTQPPAQPAPVAQQTAPPPPPKEVVKEPTRPTKKFGQKLSEENW